MKQLLKSVIQNQIIISANIEDDLSANIEDENKKNKDSKKFTLYNNVIDNLISFDPSYLNKLLAGITNINDKALIAVYTLTPRRRIMDYQLMKITHQTNVDKLKEGSNYLVIEIEIPSLFVILRHKLKQANQNKKLQYLLIYLQY